MIKTIFISLCSIIIFTSCLKRGTEGCEELERQDIVSKYRKSDYTELAKSKTDSILATLTLEEMAGQCFMPAVYADETGQALKNLKNIVEDYHVGGIILMGGEIDSVAIIGEFARKQNVPMFVALDAEWGLGMRLQGGNVFPKNGRINKNLGDSLLYDYGREIAEESRAVGVNMILGPVLDLSLSSGGPIGVRSFGNDPHLVSDYAIAYAKGLESGGVVSVAKHFPGHGSAIADTHYRPGKIYKSITAMDSTDLYPFARYIESGLSGVMAGHLDVKALSPNGEPAAVSYDILTGLLRDEMKFEGLVITDGFNMGGARGYSAVDAIKAGADIVLLPVDLKSEYTSLIEKINSGDLDLKTIEDRCRRIIFIKTLFRLEEGSTPDMADADKLVRKERVDTLINKLLHD